MSALTTMFQELANIEHHRAQAHAEGQPALQRLALAARLSSGQARIVGRFLLGLYDAHSYPFPLSDLRGLDLDLFQDCLAVLRMDYHPVREIHEYLTDGPELFRQLQNRLPPALEE